MEVIMKTIVKVPALLLVIFCAVIICTGQDKLRRVEQPAKFVYSNTPIRVDINLDGQLMANREAQAGPDWLRSLSLEVTNTSDKDIKSLMINLTIREPIHGISRPDPETVGIVIPVELRYSEVKILAVGDRVNLKPPPNMVDYWTKYASEHGMTEIEKVILDIRQVGFTDDTLWTRGRLSRKDPKTGNYVFISNNLGSPASIFIPEVSSTFFFDTRS